MYFGGGKIFTVPLSLVLFVVLFIVDFFVLPFLLPNATENEGPTIIINSRSNIQLRNWQKSTLKPVILRLNDLVFFQLV